MRELDPSSNAKSLTQTTGESAPDIMSDELKEVDSYNLHGIIVRLMLNQEVSRAYVEVNDPLAESSYAIPISEGQNARKIFDDPFAYLRVAELIANAKAEGEEKVYAGREDESLFEVMEIPETLSLVKQRTNDGISVELFEDDKTGKKVVSVMDTKGDGGYFSLEPRTEKEAEEMYNHPFSFFGRRGSDEAVHGFEQEVED